MNNYIHSLIQKLKKILDKKREVNWQNKNKNRNRKNKMFYNYINYKIDGFNLRRKKVKDKKKLVQSNSNCKE